MKTRSDDWDPRAESVLANPLESYDSMRAQCPVAYSEYLQWSLFRHDDIMRVLQDHQAFSSAVSAHVSVPNSMDPPEHTHYRGIIEPYFSPEAMMTFEPLCRELVRKLVDRAPTDTPFDCIDQLAKPFALEVQCEFLGWPKEQQARLRLWMEQNQAAVLAGNRTRMGEVALEFSLMVAEILAQKRIEQTPDVIGSLTRDKVYGRLLKDEEITSILRNWTGGEVGTITAAVGIIIYFLAQHQDIQTELRAHPEKIPEAIDEILRIHGPLMTNRRITTCPVTLNGRDIDAGERLTLFWVSANRDESVFENAQTFQWNRNPADNLLYGAGIHVCPGAPLARLELKLIIEEIMKRTHHISLAQAPAHAAYPAGGFNDLFIVFERC